MQTSIKIKRERRTKYYNWDKDILPSIRHRLKEFEAQKVKPSLRGLLYVLESENILKKYDYQGLSRKLTQWREDGILPFDCLSDNTRQIIDIHQYVPKGRRIIIDFNEGHQSWDQLVGVPEHIATGIQYLDDVAEDLYKYIPR